jgi:hypothetical protein
MNWYNFVLIGIKWMLLDSFDEMGPLRDACLKSITHFESVPPKAETSCWLAGASLASLGEKGYKSLEKP